ncbi:MAG: serine/threonine-protein kinase [Candidatus Thiodiazotropha sp.]
MSGRVGNYRLVRLIGQGGMGVVYEAIQAVLERRVAVKLLNDKLASNQELAERFITEAQVAANLRHDNIVTVYESGISDGSYFYAMEYIDGFSLSELIEKKGPVPSKDILPLIMQATEGLDCAWNQGIVHRDIKPGNLMLTTNGRLKIADFGIAKAYSDNSAHETRTGIEMGTPLYSSPEQDEDAKRVDLRSDIYSLGATFYHLITGFPPYEGKYAKITESLVPIRRRVPEVPDKLASIIEKMLAQRPEHRYQNSQEIFNALSLLIDKFGGLSLEDLLKRANAAFYRGEVREALSNIRAANQLYQPTTDTLNTEAICLADLSEHKQAINCLDQVLEIDQDHTAAWHNKGRSLRALGESGEALVCFMRAIESGREQDQIWMSWKSLGNCHRDLGQLNEAAKAYNKSLSLFPDAETRISLDEILEQIKSDY